jgi:hypothetical protein
MVEQLNLRAPRYEVRVLPIGDRRGPRIHGCFDTFTQEWTSIEPLARTVAERTVRNANRTYESGGLPLALEEDR